MSLVLYMGEYKTAERVEGWELAALWAAVEVVRLYCAAGELGRLGCRNSACTGGCICTHLAWTVPQEGCKMQGRHWVTLRCPSLWIYIKLSNFVWCCGVLCCSLCDVVPLHSMPIWSVLKHACCWPLCCKPPPPSTLACHAICCSSAAMNWPWDTRCSCTFYDMQWWIVNIKSYLNLLTKS